MIAHYGDETGMPVKKKVDFQNIEYQKCKLCKYCEISFPINELKNYMTLLMIIQLDKYL